MKNLSVPVLLGRSFIDHFVKAIFALDPKIVLYYFDPVPILLIIKENDKQKRKEGKNSVMRLEVEDDKN